MNPRVMFALASVVGGVGVVVWRFQETRSPITARRIVIPPLGMSTGFMMFVSPAMRIPWSWALTAFLLGAAILAIPLIRSSTLERSGEQVLLQRSNGFFLILLGLLALRLALHEYVGHLLSPRQTASVFFVLAFGMIVRWRLDMYRRFRVLMPAPPPPEQPSA